MSFILSLVSIEVIGLFFMLLVIRRSRYHCSNAETFSVSFLIGMGLISYLLTAYYLLGMGFSPVNIFAVPVALTVLIFARYASVPRRMNEFLPEKGTGGRWSLTEKLLAAGLIVQFLWILFLVIPIPVNSHDAVGNYALKAKMFHFAGGIPAGFFNWSETTISHPDYPPLLPFLMTWVYAFTAFNDLNINLVMPVVYAAFLVLFYSQMKRFFSRRYSLILVFLLGTIAQLYDYATVIHADLILTAMVTCAFGYFLLYLRDRDRFDLVLSSLLFGFCLLTKNEGMVFAGAFTVALISYVIKTEPARRRAAAADAGMALAIVAAVSVPWFAVKVSSSVINSDIDISALTAGRVWQNVKDIPVLLNLFQQEVFAPKKWNIFWVMVFAGMIWKHRVLWKGRNFYITLFLTLSAAGYFAGYMATTGNNLFFYVNTTISRFMLHFCGIALLLLAFLVREDVEEVEKLKED